MEPTTFREVLKDVVALLQIIYQECIATPRTEHRLDDKWEITPVKDGLGLYNVLGKNGAREPNPPIHESRKRVELVMSSRDRCWAVDDGHTGLVDVLDRLECMVGHTEVGSDVQTIIHTTEMCQIIVFEPCFYPVRDLETDLLGRYRENVASLLDEGYEHLLVFPCEFTCE